MLLKIYRFFHVFWLKLSGCGIRVGQMGCSLEGWGRNNWQKLPETVSMQSYSLKQEVEILQNNLYEQHIRCCFSVPEPSPDNDHLERFDCWVLVSLFLCWWMHFGTLHRHQKGHVTAFKGMLGKRPLYLPLHSGSHPFSPNILYSHGPLLCLDLYPELWSISVSERRDIII